MALILPRPGDIIPVKIGDLTFHISPINEDKRIDRNNFTKIVNGEEVEDESQMVIHLVKNSIKKVEGVTNWDGSDYILTFNDDGSMTDKSIQDVVRLGNLDHVIMACTQIVNSIPQDGKIRNPITGEIVPGAEVIFPKKPEALVEIGL